MSSEVSPTFMKGCHTFVSHTVMKSPGKNKLRGKGFILVWLWSMLAGKSRQRLEKGKVAKLVNNSTSNSREGISIYIPAA